MNVATACPNSHHTDLHCNAHIRATLRSRKDDSETVQLSLLEWDQIESVDSYECLNCGYIFIDDKANEFQLFPNFEDFLGCKAINSDE